MQRQNPSIPHRTERKPAMLSSTRPGWRDIALLVVGYVALDWASFIHPLHGLNITPWNPAPALGLVLLLRHGARMVPPIVVAILIAEIWVRGLPAALPVTVAVAALLTGGYWLIATVIYKYLPEGVIFADRRGLFIWAAAVSAGTLLTSGIFVVALALSGYVPMDVVDDAVLQFWVGDGAGVLVSMPLLWMLFDDYRRRQLRQVVFHPGFLAYLALIAVALWVAFGLGASAAFKYFYALFIPIAWAASRHGLPGAVIAAALIQFGIILAVKSQEIAAITVLEIQILAAVTALFGFFIGVVVDEKQRVSNELRQTLRLAAAGEMAGALAHELNQPLTALSAYGSACEQLLDRGDTGPTLRDALRGMIRESHRAAEVLRRLRDFFRTGSTRLEPIDLAELIDAAATSFAARGKRDAVTLAVGPIPPLRLLGDRLQLEVVLRNLLSNAFDAVAEHAPGERRIRLDARDDGGSRVCIVVEDNGAGFDEARLAGLFDGFRSTKSSGLGLGLMISRAITEAHGGSLWAETGDHGIFKLSLPTEGTSPHAD